MNTIKSIMEQNILITSQFDFKAEDHPALSEYLSSFTHGRDKGGEYAVASFIETAENYDYLHSLFGKELSISVKNAYVGSDTSLVRMECKKARWVAEHSELNYGTDSVCNLVVRLEFI